MNATLLAAALLFAAVPAAAAPTSVAGMSPAVLEAAVAAYQKVAAEGRVQKPVLTVIDYSVPSTMRRLWVIDMTTNEVLFHELVSHGKNSGWDKPTKFSNVDGSLMSSVGVFVTGSTYVGKHGRSLYLDGLEPGFNDKARARAIVIHAADYVTETYAKREGRLGRSWGCPALDPKIAPRVIDTIANGSVVFSYYPDQAWLTSSKYVAAAQG
jgi:hypothetical protein